MNVSTGKRTLVFMVLAAFLTIGLLGLFHFSMNMESVGEHGCPLTNSVVYCLMNPLQHIATWQNAFLSFFPEDLFLMFSIALLGILSVLLFGDYLINKNIQLARYVLIKRYFKLILKVGSPLHEAFSRGIINTKKYGY